MATRAPIRRAAPARAPAAATPARGRAAPAARASSSYRGTDGMRKAQEVAEQNEAQREASRAMAGAPFRFYTPVGETRRIVIVDDAPDFFRWEHALMNPRSGRFDNYVPCIDEHAECPACKVAERPAYFAMYLTIIDLEPYVNKQNEEVEFSKKLMVVKPMQQKKITRLYERHTTLRGMILDMTRESNQDAAIGDMEFFDFMDEEELVTYQTSYVDKENKEHEVDCSEPYDYSEIFPDITEKQLRAICGTKATPGSREDNDATLGRSSRRPARDGWQDDAPAPRTASRRGRAAPAEDVEDVPEEDIRETPRRGRAPAAAAAPARGAVRRQAVDPDDVDPDAVDENDPPFDADPPRRAAGRAAPARAPAGRGRAAPEDDAPPVRRGRAAPVEEDDPPQRQARTAGVSARRANLRRG